MAVAHTGDRLRLDLHEPPRVEQARDDPCRRGPCSAECCPVGAADRLDVLGAGDEMRVRTTSSSFAPASPSARAMMSMQMRACS